MCRACSGKWAGSNPGARCPSQRGAARREYQNARNARARQRREADEHFGETPRAADPLAGTDLASMPVAEFLDQATPQQVSSAIEFVDRHRVPAVFCESTVSDAPMKQVVNATDARFGGTLYVDSLSEADGPVPTYLDLIRHDVATIVSGLTGSNT